MGKSWSSEETQLLRRLFRPRSGGDDFGLRLALGVRCAAEMPADIAGRSTIARKALRARVAMKRAVKSELRALDGALPEAARVGGDDILSPLLAAVAHRNKHRRLGAIDALRAMGGAAATPKVVASLMRCLADPTDDEQLREAAIGALERMGTGVATAEFFDALWGRIVDDDDLQIRQRATDALVTLIRLHPALADRLVVDKLTDEVSPSLKVHLLTQIDFGSRPRVVAFIRALAEDTNQWEWVRGVAQGLVSAADESDGGLTRTISRLVFGERRESAVIALRAFDPATAIPRALEVTLDLLKGDDFRSYMNAFDALVALGPQAATPEVLSLLLTRVANPMWRPMVRQLQAKIIPAARAATKPRQGVASFVGDILSSTYGRDTTEDRYIRTIATESLRKIAPFPVELVTAMILFRRLERKNAKVRSRAVIALGAMGARAATVNAVDLLISVVQEEINPYTSSYVPLHGLWALGNMGAAAATPRVLATLRTLLSDSDQRIRAGAAKTLGRLAPAAADSELLAAVVNATRDTGESDYHELRPAAVQSLDSLQRDAGIRFVAGRPHRTIDLACWRLRD
jgi:HEAT repeat protein